MMTSRAIRQPPIDRGWAWMVVLGNFLATFVLSGTMRSFGIIFVEIIETFKVSVTQASLIMSLTLFSYALVAPISILIAKKITVRKVAIFGAVVGFIGFALTSLLYSITYVIIINGLTVGMSHATIYPTGLFLLNQYFKKRRSLANGLGLCGGSFGQLAFPPVIEYLLETYSLSGTLLLLSAIFFNVAVAGMLYRPIESCDTVMESEYVEEDEKQCMMTKEDITDDNKNLQVQENGKSAHLPDKDFKLNKINDISVDKKPKTFISKFIDLDECKSYVTLLYMFAGPLAVCGQMNFIMYLPAVVLEKGITSYEKATLVSLAGAGDLISKIIMGLLGDTNFIPRYIIVATQCAACGAMVFAIGASDSFLLLAFECLAFGFFAGGVMSSLLVVLVDFVGLRRFGSNLALFSLVEPATTSSTYLVLGILKDSTQSYVVVSLVCGLILVTAAIILVLYPLVRRLDAKKNKSIKNLNQSHQHEILKPTERQL